MMVALFEEGESEEEEEGGLGPDATIVLGDGLDTWIPYDEVREGGGRDSSKLHVILLGVIAYGLVQQPLIRVCQLSIQLLSDSCCMFMSFEIVLFLASCIGYVEIFSMHILRFNLVLRPSSA